MAAETSQTLDRGLAVLDLVASRVEPVGVSEVAECLGVSRTVVYRLVATLEQRGYLRRDDAGLLQLGAGALRLATAAQPAVSEVVAPVLRQLAEQVGATAHLTMADGDEALALLVVEPVGTDFFISYRAGARHPLSRGAAGKAILLDRLPRSADSASYAVSVGELQPGAVGLAAPVQLAGFSASVGVIALGECIDEERVGSIVVAAAEEIGRRLGS